MFVDLGAERLVAAEKADQKIAVQIKGFGGPSEMVELEKAIGQLTLYRSVLAKREPEYVLYLAVPEEVVRGVFQQPLGRLLIENAWRASSGLIRWRRESFNGQARTIPAGYENIFDEYAAIPYSLGELSCGAVFDRARDRYLLVTYGRDLSKRVHFAVAHVDIVDGKLWVRCDNTEEGIATELVAAGVPKGDIVPGFKSEEMRRHTEFAVA